MSHFDKMFQLPKYSVDALAGLTQYEWRSRTYVAPLAADVDYIINEFEPTADNTWIDISANILNDGLPDVYRNLTVTVTDANSSCSVWVHVWGEDQFYNAQQEILRVSAGEGSVVGQGIWSSVTAIKYKASGSVDAGLDTVAVGIGNILGLPKQIGDDTPYNDVRRFISDTGGTPDDELANASTEISKEYSSVLPATNVPNGTMVYFCEVYATSPNEGVLPIRPRAHRIITTN